jgi:hypothetical protein
MVKLVWWVGVRLLLPLLVRRLRRRAGRALTGWLPPGGLLSAALARSGLLAGREERSGRILNGRASRLRRASLRKASLRKASLRKASRLAWKLAR